MSLVALLIQASRCDDLAEGAALEHYAHSLGGVGKRETVAERARLPSGVRVGAPSGEACPPPAKSFSTPDEVRRFPLGHVDIINLDETVLGRFQVSPVGGGPRTSGPSQGRRPASTATSGTSCPVTCTSMEDGTEQDPYGDAYVRSCRARCSGGGRPAVWRRSNAAASAFGVVPPGEI